MSTVSVCAFNEMTRAWDLCFWWVLSWSHVWKITGVRLMPWSRQCSTPPWVETDSSFLKILAFLQQWRNGWLLYVVVAERLSRRPAACSENYTPAHRPQLVIYCSENWNPGDRSRCCRWHSPQNRWISWRSRACKYSLAVPPKIRKTFWLGSFLQKYRSGAESPLFWGHFGQSWYFEHPEVNCQPYVSEWVSE